MGRTPPLGQYIHLQTYCLNFSTSKYLQLQCLIFLKIWGHQVKIMTWPNTVGNASLGLLLQALSYVSEKRFTWKVFFNIPEHLRPRCERSGSPPDQMWAKMQFSGHNFSQIHVCNELLLLNAIWDITHFTVLSLIQPPYLMEPLPSLCKGLVLSVLLRLVSSSPSLYYMCAFPVATLFSSQFTTAPSHCFTAWWL